MASTKQVEVDGNDAAAITGVDEAQHMELLRRINSLEYALVRTRDALRVITRSLEDLAEGHASEGERKRGLTQEDVSTLYGAVSLLDSVASDCDRAFNGE